MLVYIVGLYGELYIRIWDLYSLTACTTELYMYVLVCIVGMYGVLCILYGICIVGLFRGLYVYGACIA